jgi:hypothetical protein|tara:strand:- start:304 stop:480 length:177 start_codon:yes stop_codon:yes gene_type:complete
MSKEYQVNSTEISEKKDCKSCTNGLNMGQKFIVGFSIYMLGTSIYGTIELVKLLVNLF